MGTPEFARAALMRLADSHHDVVGVASQPPRPSGRGMKLRPSPVHQEAEARAIPVFTPEKLKDPEVSKIWTSLQADLAMVAAYGLILPRHVLEMFPQGCFNLHASLLPRWRGAAPIQRAIMAGDQETGVCFMGMSQGLDEGPVYAEVRCPIADEDTASILHDRLTFLAADHVVQWVDDLVTGQLTAKPQETEGVTYAAKIDKDEAIVEFDQPAMNVARMINGLSPFPGAWSMIGGERVKLLFATHKPWRHGSNPGEIIQADDDGMVVACGQDVVVVTKLQRAGKGAQEVGSFLRGFSVSPGQVLG